MIETTNNFHNPQKLMSYILLPKDQGFRTIKASASKVFGAYCPP